MTNICKEFPGVKALDNACLEVRRGEVHILVGENGAGKSTLIRILSGAYSKDSGNIELGGQPVEITSPNQALRLGIATIYQELNLVPSLTVAENIMLGREPMSSVVKTHLNWKGLFANAQRVLDELHLDINPEEVVKNLSLAQRQMVEVAKALSQNAKIIIMDEPTAALSETEIARLFEIIETFKGLGGSVIYISHRLEEFAKIGERVTVMRDGKTVATLPIAEAGTQTLIRLMAGREITEQYPHKDRQPGAELLRLEGAGTAHVRGVSLSLKAGEVLGVSGLMGSGRTELARMIFGVDQMTEGEMTIAGERVKLKGPKDAIAHRIGFVTEDRKDLGLVLPMTVKENITLIDIDSFLKFGFLSGKKEQATAREYIDKLSIKTPTSGQKVMYLSGGNQQKVVVSKWLLSQSKILIFDEPTRGIDVGARYEIYNLMNQLLDQGVGIILISSDMPEVIGMADRILVMSRGAQAAELTRAEADQEKILYYATGGVK